MILLLLGSSEDVPVVKKVKTNSASPSTEAAISHHSHRKLPGQVFSLCRGKQVDTSIETVLCSCEEAPPPPSVLWNYFIGFVEGT